jgi:hypothetical protein
MKLGWSDERIGTCREGILSGDIGMALLNIFRFYYFTKNLTNHCLYLTCFDV